jgi:hypothetical protein
MTGLLYMYLYYNVILAWRRVYKRIFIKKMHLKNKAQNTMDL